jgi:hypothetical protein
MLVKLKISTSPKHALEFFKTLDTSQKGHITYPEFREYIESDD